MSLVGGRQGRKLTPVGLQREDKASRGQSITPQRSSFLPPGSDDRCWAQAAAEGVVLATMVTSIFSATSSPSSSPDLAPTLPTGGSGHFSLPGCLELVVVVGGGGGCVWIWGRRLDEGRGGAPLGWWQTCDSSPAGSPPQGILTALEGCGSSEASSHQGLRVVGAGCGVGMGCIPSGFLWAFPPLLVLPFPALRC